MQVKEAAKGKLLEQNADLRMRLERNQVKHVLPILPKPDQDQLKSDFKADIELQIRSLPVEQQNNLLKYGTIGEGAREEASSHSIASGRCGRRRSH